MKIRKAVIPAAGLGTRFLPATKAMPKEMLPLVDKPIIQYVVEEAVEAGIEDIIIITGRGKRAIEDHFDRSIELEMHLQTGSKMDVLEQLRSISDMVNVHFIRQKEPMGLGHAVLQARRHVGSEPFAVLLGDEVFRGNKPCLKELIEQYEDRGGGGVIAVRSVPPAQVSRYGVVDPSPIEPGLYLVRGLVEKPTPQDAPSNLAVVGRYIIDSDIFAILEDLPPGRTGEIQLTDGLDRLAQRVPMYAQEIKATRYDVGDKLGFIQATLEFALSRDELKEDLKEYLRALMSRV